MPRARLRTALKVLGAWAGILGVGLAGLELYARRVSSRVFEIDKRKVYNRRFYEAHREYFSGRGPLDLFESAEPEPKYLFKPGLRTRCGRRFEPAKPGEKPCWSSNSWGFRGAEFELRKPKGALRIVCLGASTTEGACSDKETYPYYLQEELRARYPGRAIEVINAGHSGATVDDLHAILRKKVLPLRPDIVVFYEAANNVRVSEFMSAPSCVVAPQIRRNDCLGLTYPGWRRFLRRRSAAFTILERLLDGDPREPPPMPHLFDDKNAKPGAAHYREKLRDIVQEARRAGVRIILSSFVVVAREGLERSLGRDTPLWKDIHLKHYPFSAGEVGRMYAYYNAQSMAVAAELEVPYADVAAEFPKEARYFPNDIMHLGPEGNKMLAKLFARFLERRVL